MEKYKKYCCKRKTKITELLWLLEKTHKKTVIVEEEGRLCGIITDGDIRRHLLNSGDMTVEAEQIMNRNPVYLEEDEKDQAYQCMNKNLIDAVPVVNKKGLLCDVIFRYDEFTEKKKIKESLHIPVVIMAGGKGTRLMPYTNVLPKPLMPMKNKTAIECIMDTFYECGCDDYYLILNYKKEIIKAYFDGIEKAYHLNYIEEKNFMGTGGGLFYLKDKMTTTFIVSNCDVLLNIHYADVLKNHLECGNQITMIVADQHYRIPYGTVSVTLGGAVAELKEKPEFRFLVNTGVYLIEPDAIADLEERYYDMTDVIKEMIRLKKRVGTYTINENDWIDVGEISGLTKYSI